MAFKYDRVTLRKVQMSQFNILKNVDEICKANGIRYHLFAGSLLGAVRHKGFIPWDDDIDICMSRKDYDKFNSLASNNFRNRNLFLQNSLTDKNFIFPFTKVRLNNTVFEEEAVEDLNIHKGIYIDIFPLDNIEKSILGDIQKYSLILLEKINLCYVKKICLSIENPIIKRIALIINKILKIIPQRFVYSLILVNMKLFRNKDTEYVSHLSNSLSKSRFEKYKMKKEDLDKTIFTEFEGDEFPIPENYENVLENLFGNYNKMPPIENRVPHHGIIRVEF